jgi:hypothetical protein
MDELQLTDRLDRLRGRSAGTLASKNLSDAAR